MSLRLAWSTQSQDSQGSVRRPPSQNKTNKQTPAKYHFLFFHIALFYFASSFPPGASQVNVYVFLMEDVGTQFAIRKTGQRHRIFLVCPCSGPNPQSAGHSNFSVINPFGPSVCPGVCAALRDWPPLKSPTNAQFLLELWTQGCCGPVWLQRPTLSTDQTLLESFGSTLHLASGGKIHAAREFSPASLGQELSNHCVSGLAFPDHFPPCLQGTIEQTP